MSSPRISIAAPIGPRRPTRKESTRFPAFPSGDYELRVEAQGFKTYVQERLHLDVNQRARLDIPMEVGGITETVSVIGRSRAAADRDHAGRHRDQSRKRSTTRRAHQPQPDRADSAGAGRDDAESAGP